MLIVKFLKMHAVWYGDPDDQEREEGVGIDRIALTCMI